MIVNPTADSSLPEPQGEIHEDCKSLNVANASKCEWK